MKLHWIYEFLICRRFYLKTAWNEFLDFAPVFHKNIIEIFYSVKQGGLSDIFRSKHFSIESAKYHLGWIRKSGLTSQLYWELETKSEVLVLFKKSIWTIIGLGRQSIGYHTIYVLQVI